MSNYENYEEQTYEDEPDYRLLYSLLIASLAKSNAGIQAVKELIVLLKTLGEVNEVAAEQAAILERDFVDRAMTDEAAERYYASLHERLGQLSLSLAATTAMCEPGARGYWEETLRRMKQVLVNYPADSTQSEAAAVAMDVLTGNHKREYEHEP